MSPTCLAGLAVLLLSLPAAAADFRWEPAPETAFFAGTLYLEGEIQEGDREKLIAALGGHQSGTGYPIFLQLDSKGGIFSEAMKIADVAREKALATRLGPNAECLSACAIIFMSGMGFNNTYDVIWRVMHPTAKLGFHAPDPGISGGGNFDSADLDNAFSSAVEQIGKDLLKVARFRVSSWANPRIKAGLINEMMIHRGKDFYYIDTVGKAAEYEIALDNAEGPPTLTTDNRVAACQNTIALWTDRAGADEAAEGWLDGSHEKRSRSSIKEADNEWGGIGPTTYSYPYNRAKGFYCDVIPRANFGRPRPSPTDGDDSSNLVALGIANGGKYIGVEDWYFWPPDKPLAEVPAR